MRNNCKESKTDKNIREFDDEPYNKLNETESFSKRVRHYIKQNNMKEEEIKELFEQFEAIANE